MQTALLYQLSLLTTVLSPICEGNLVSFLCFLAQEKFGSYTVLLPRGIARAEVTPCCNVAAELACPVLQWFYPILSRLLPGIKPGRAVRGLAAEIGSGV